MKTRDQLVSDIASEIVNDEVYVNMEWDSVSVVVCFDGPSIWDSGIVYIENEYISKNPRSRELVHRMVELRDNMKEEDGKAWIVCLIKISALTQQIDIDFEYEDIKRWYLTPTLDRDELKAYAMSIK